MSKKHSFLISIEVQDYVSTSDLVKYVETAINGWKGGLSSEDPLTSIINVKVQQSTRLALSQLKQKGN